MQSIGLIALLGVILPACISGMIGYLVYRANSHRDERSLDIEEDKLTFEVWKSGQDELRVQLEEAKREIEELKDLHVQCEAARDKDRAAAIAQTQELKAELYDLGVKRDLLQSRVHSSERTIAELQTQVSSLQKRLSSYEESM